MDVDVVTFSLKGRVTVHTVGSIWAEAAQALARNPDRPIVIDASRLEYIDATGIALIYDLQRGRRPAGAEVEIRGLDPSLAALIPSYDPVELEEPARGGRGLGAIERIGRATLAQLSAAARMLTFLADCGVALLQAIPRRGIIRWGEVLSVAAEAGANAVPIVLLIGFLMGVIIAFEIGLVAQQFGAVIFVVDGVGVAVLRELGALMTAIVFAGRTGAAFAAQIGTQKVNEEVSAIVTFGLDPLRFLVLPRLIAAVLVVPLLTVLADVVGIFGGALVLAGFNIGFVQFYNHLLGAVGIEDFLVGLAKAAIFGLAIAAIGCQRGLATGAGATSVGLSATSAVVTSIVWIVVLDGLFTVLISS
ncbi:STAS domain-containing protein [Thiorhodococcus minor]|uniref:STAS domain-containing protein n=2 Tax=Thiorhodococcus minor TaxID=57489 RepID=A0A6M0K228_9GAMM|nr:ABC transporter permease [Thiorhodococcus minor]NEV63796.1 STAS domain-containing protein [Thiorhodococcus minor]